MNGSKRINIWGCLKTGVPRGAQECPKPLFFSVQNRALGHSYFETSPDINILDDKYQNKLKSMGRKSNMLPHIHESNHKAGLYLTPTGVACVPKSILESPPDAVCLPCSPTPNAKRIESVFF